MMRAGDYIVIIAGSLFVLWVMREYRREYPEREFEVRAQDDYNSGLADMLSSSDTLFSLADNGDCAL